MVLKEKGQAFESFRLLIAFVLMTAVLVIILSMVHRTNTTTIIISTQKLDDGFLSASKSPGASTKTPFVIKDLKLSGIISKRSLSNTSGMDPNCIFFKIGPGIKELNNGDAQITKKYLKMNVTVYCDFKENVDNGTVPQYINNIITSTPSHSSHTIDECNSQTYCVLFLNSAPPTEIYNNN